MHLYKKQQRQHNIQRKIIQNIKIHKNPVIVKEQVPSGVNLKKLKHSWQSVWE